MAHTVAVPSLTLSVAECAWELACSEDFIRTLIARKQLPASKVGGRILIKREAVEQLLSRTQL
jgi:excisionase family DNA binding protein